MPTGCCEEADYRHRRLLRSRRERPRRRAAEERDELASSYAEHGLPSRKPLCQLTAGSGWIGSVRQVLGVDLNCSESRIAETLLPLAPEILEPVGCQLGVTHRVLN